MVAIATELQTMQASMFLAQEMNTAWAPTVLNALQNRCHTVYPQHKLAVASSTEKLRVGFNQAEHAQWHAAHGPAMSLDGEQTNS